MLVILSGVSGAGKDTIKKELIKRMENVISLPSFTSRGPRPGEEEGIQYHFISKEEFKEKINNGEFYEYDLHHENYYGTSKKLMNEKIQSGKIIVKDIEVNLAYRWFLGYLITEKIPDSSTISQNRIRRFKDTDMVLV